MTIDIEINNSPSNLNLYDFVNFFLNNNLETSKQLICRRNAHISEYSQNNPFSFIDKTKCDNCLSCFNQEMMNILFNNIDHLNYDSFIQQISYKYSNNERLETTPYFSVLINNLLINDGETLSRFSPFKETNISSNYGREGQLDFVLINKTKKYIIILESKKDNKALIRDIPRDQWNKYIDEIYTISKKFNFSFYFGYVIGGDESFISNNSEINEKYLKTYLDDKFFITLNAIIKIFILYKKNNIDLLIDYLFKKKSTAYSL